MSDTPFIGMRGSEDFLETEEIQNWRQGIMRTWPNGDVPLTALTALMASEQTNNVRYYWHTKTLPTQRATVTGIYTSTNLSSAYSTGGIAGQTLYLKVGTEVEAKRFRAGHQVLLRVDDDHSVDVNAKVTGVVLNGSSSYISVRLLEADDNGVAIAGVTHDLSDIDTVLVIGNINADGATRPEGIVYQPSSHENQCQIFRNALDITRRAMKTTLRTGNAYQEAKLDVLQDHTLEIEKALLWSIKTTNTGANGKDETTTMGLIPWIKTYASANCLDYRTDSDFAGMTWTQGGEKWLDKVMSLIFATGSIDSRLAFCGSGAMLGIQTLARANGIWTLTPNMTKYGFGVTEWETVDGTLNMKKHPLFSFEETNKHSAVIFVPKNLKYRYIDDTDFHEDVYYGRGGGDGKDAKSEEWLTDAGLEFYWPDQCAYINGIGQDNILDA